MDPELVAALQREWWSRRRAALLGLSAEASRAVVPSPSAEDWAGPARRAFDRARGRLAAAVALAAHHLDEAAQEATRQEYALAVAAND